MTPETDAPGSTLLTGVAGLDDVLHGGLTPDRLYLLEGMPGSGKTTLGLQFLMEGARRGERCLIVTLSETEEELRAVARAHGWSLDGVDIMEVIRPDEALEPDSRYTMFHPSEVELSATMARVISEVERIRPQRMVFDALSELRLLSEEPLRYRRQVLSLKRLLASRHCTVICTDDRSGELPEMQLHSISHGVIRLELSTPGYGIMRRRLQVTKMRGRAFREGYHDYRIRRGGIELFPRLVASEHRVSYAREEVSSGVERLDALLGGGLPRGSTTLLMGPAGAGKSTLAAQYALHAAQRGENASIFMFDESLVTFLERSRGLGLAVEPLLQSGKLHLRPVDAAEMPPGEFAQLIRKAVETGGTRVVVIDSINGYMNPMPSEQFLKLHLHELVTYLGQRGVLTLLVLASQGVAGPDLQMPVDASYLADTVILLRYFEALGTVRQAISVIKKRTGPHERTIRELRLDGGIQIGEPIERFQGVLAGTPILLPGGPGTP